MSINADRLKAQTPFATFVPYHQRQEIKRARATLARLNVSSKHWSDWLWQSVLIKTRRRAELMPLSSTPTVTHLVSSHMYRQTGFVGPVSPQQISFDFNPQNLHSWRTAHKMLIKKLKTEWLEILFLVSFKSNYSRCIETHNAGNRRRLSLTRGVLGQSIFCHTSTPKCVHDKRLPSTYPTLLCKVPHARRG